MVKMKLKQTRGEESGKKIFVDNTGGTVWKERASTDRYSVVIYRATAPFRLPGAVFMQDALQSAHQLLGVDRFLAPEAVHLLVEVSELHPGLREMAQLLG